MKAGSKKRTAESMMAREPADGSSAGNGDTATAAAASSSDGAPVVDDLEAKRRKDVLKDMEKIEKEFADLKEKLFAKKMKDLHDECKAIMEARAAQFPNLVSTCREKTSQVAARATQSSRIMELLQESGGSHDGFLKRAQELEIKKNSKVWMAEKWKEYQLQNIEHVFQFECLQAEEEYNHERRSLRDEMANEILDKQKKLEEEKSTMSLRGDGNGDARAVKGRVLRNRRGGKDKDGGYGQAYSRHKTAQPPHINYTLNDDEIMTDLSLMKKRELPPSDRRRLCQEASDWMAPLPNEGKSAKLGA